MRLKSEIVLLFVVGRHFMTSPPPPNVSDDDLCDNNFPAFVSLNREREATAGKMSDSDSDDGAPPPPRSLGTGLYRRLTLTNSHLGAPRSLSPVSSTASPMVHQQSFQWEAAQSFRLYANHSRSVLASRRGTTHLLGLADSQNHVDATSPAAELKSAFKALKDYIVLYGTLTLASDSKLPINIRKGKLIGSGGFAEVFAGINTLTGELVAIKEIRISDVTNRKELAAVEEEFVLLRQLRHENVVRYILFEQSISQKMCRIVMEFMAGGSAQGLLQKFGPLTESIVKRFATDMLKGIAFIHKEGIIHRDIKPANILVSATGQLKLADFGCSRRITEINSGTSCIIGTPVYMAPEFIRGETTPKADIWATGCTLFELATGLTPWHHTGVKDNLPLMFYITTSSDTPMVLPAKDDRNFSNGFVDFLERCFIRDIRKRPDAEELLKHPWIMDMQDADVESQREIEDVTVAQSVELCHTLCTEPLMDTKELSSCNSTPRLLEVREDSYSAEDAHAVGSPQREPVSSRGSPQFGAFSAFDASMSGLASSKMELHPTLSQGTGGQCLLLNQESGHLEFATVVNDEEVTDDVPIPTIEEPSHDDAARSPRRIPRKSFSSVSFCPPPEEGTPYNPSNALTSTVVPQLVLDGPVRMSFSFKANGEKVSVGLDIQPEDVTCRIVDRRPSFVVAMNDHIRGQLTSAMMELHHRRVSRADSPSEIEQ